MTELARTWLHEALHDWLMDAYWADGEDLGDHDVLRRARGSVGPEADEVDDVLRSDRYLDRVAASTQEAVSIGVTGVPAFLLDGRLLVLGAQPRRCSSGPSSSSEQRRDDARPRGVAEATPLLHPHPPWVGHEA